MGGSSGKSQTVGYRYSFDIHFALGLPLDEIIEIRASDKTAWKGSIANNGQIQISAPNLFGGDKGEGGLEGPLDVLFGEETQGVLPKLAAMLGGIVPAFRGITTCFYSGLITSINPYPKPWEILRRGGNRLWGTQAPWYPSKQFIWLADNQIKAMNPAHILYLIYTGRKFRGLPRERMDESSWVAAADALYSEGLGLCLEWRKTDSFKSFRDAVLAHISAEVYVNRYTGLLSIRLLRSDYDVNSLPLFDEDSGLLEVLEEESSSIDNASVPSEVLIDYIDAITGETRQVRAVNAAVAARDGGRSAETISYPGAPTFEVASRLAVRDLRIKTSGLKRYKVTLDRRGRTLTPGQPFRLRSINRGIAQVVVRAGRIEDGTLTDGRMTVVALQDVFGLDFNNFVTPPPSGWEPPSRTPEAIVTRRIIEASYRDMVQNTDPANLSLIDPTQAYIAALAVAPTSMSQSYTLVTRVGSTGSFVEGETGDWCPTALCAAVPLQATATVITLSGGFRLEDVALGSAAMIDNEIVRVDAINLSASTVTVARGCVDTVPAAHTEGARIWFYEDASVADETSYSAGVTLQAKLLTNTSEGQLSEALAATDSLTLQGRQGKPYPPGQFKIGGAYYPASVTGEVALTWAHRDRITQSDQIIDTTMGSIGPESGVTYSARLLRADTNTVLVSQTGLTTTAATLISEFAGQAKVELYAVRGTLESLRQTHAFQYSGSLITSLLHFEGASGSTTFTDQRGLTWTAAGNAAITTAGPKIGTGCLLLDGNGDWIQTASGSAYNFGTGDFTIEARVNLSANTNYYSTILAGSQPSYATGCRFLMMYGSSVSVVAQRNRFSFGGFSLGTDQSLLLSTTTYALNTWYHVAVSRSGNTFRLFINGVLESTATSTAAMDFSVSGTRIGANGWDGAMGHFAGKIDELRASKVAHYISNFTPPTAPFPNS